MVSGSAATSAKASRPPSGPFRPRSCWHRARRQRHRMGRGRHRGGDSHGDGCSWPGRPRLRRPARADAGWPRGPGRATGRVRPDGSLRPADRTDDPRQYARELGVRSLDVSCWNCRHRAVLGADRWSDEVAVPTFGPRMVCTGCGIIGADARQNGRRLHSPSGHATVVRKRSSIDGRETTVLWMSITDAGRKAMGPAS